MRLRYSVKTTLLRWGKMRLRGGDGVWEGALWHGHRVENIEDLAAAGTGDGRHRDDVGVAAGVAGVRRPLSTPSFFFGVTYRFGRAEVQDACRQFLFWR